MIKLPYGFTIDSDPYQYIIKRDTVHTNKETGEQYIEPETIGYFTKLRYALERILDILEREFVSEHDCTLPEAVDRLEGLYRELRGYLSKEEMR